MTQSVFIDGAAGTTGLEIAERLAPRAEFDLVVLDDAHRKDLSARKEALNSSDFAILCLPDDAARESVSLIDSASKTRVIDASTAHRIAPGWDYGFPEITGREKVAASARISNPGCYSTGFIALVAPLIRAGLLPADGAYTCNAVSGYSGGGKAMIARYAEETDIAWLGYALNLAHKHVPEMQAHCGLSHAPLFTPAVVPTHRGMVVEIPLQLAAINGAGSADELRACLAEFYAGSPVVHMGATPESGQITMRANRTPSDRMELLVLSSDDGSQARLIATLDNLGKGASGAAVQSLNLMSGCDEGAGLRLD